jgi:hypothetical protein
MIHEYKCNICNKKYASKQSLWNHNHKYHLPNDNKKQTIDNIHDNKKQTIDNIHDNKKQTFNDINNNRICKFCNNVFSHRNSRWKHEQKCKVKSNDDQIMELKKEINELKEKINNTQQASNINNSHNTTNTNTL